MSILTSRAIIKNKQWCIAKTNRKTKNNKKMFRNIDKNLKQRNNEEKDDKIQHC